MASPTEDLWNTLMDLTDEDFKRFKWFLKESDANSGFSAIPVAQLERADRQDTVDLMVQKYSCSGALLKSTRILEKINRNDLAQRLTNITSRERECQDRDNFRYETNKAKVAEIKAQIKLMIQERRIKICEIQRSAGISRRSADRQTADSVRVFAVLQQSVERSLANLIEEMEKKQKTTQKQADDVVQMLKQDISELTKREAELEHLHKPHDDLFFQNLSYTTKNWSETSIPQPSYGSSVMIIVDELRKKVEEETEMLLTKAKLNRIQQFAVDVTLDPDTAHASLILSDNRKQVHCGDKQQNLPDNPGRFNSAANVLGKQSFSSGKFYFEVQVKGKTGWDLGVVKESIDRKGSITASPESGHWTICLRKGDKYKAHALNLSVNTPPSKVGVFVDYEKGSVFFYNTDSAEVIHRFTNCSFREKLYPFFSPSVPYNGLNSTPLIICPVAYTD
ncbi:pyrin-like [Cololabis saira]|uniref:pyrin-like n=1 Tax=Cololabis saira TaxID=129043 RepID=UPI002AD22494|nr:pyrin-like [Cololabis saira]